MTRIIFLLLLLSCLYCCKQAPAQKVNHSLAVKLNDSATRLTYRMTDTGYQNAILLLDQATSLDSNYFLAYWNKLVFQLRLKQYNQSIITSKNLTRIRPSAPDLYFTRGYLYAKINDTPSEKDNLEKALSLYNNVLDTMNLANRDYNILFLNKAIDLIILGEASKGNDLLKQLYIRQPNKENKDLTQSFMNKTRDELLDKLDHGQPVETSTSTSQDGKEKRH